MKKLIGMIVVTLIMVLTMCGCKVITTEITASTTEVVNGEVYIHRVTTRDGEVTSDVYERVFMDEDPVDVMVYGHK